LETLSLSEAKIKLSRLVDKVNTSDEAVVITKNGRPAAVLVSPSEFEGWTETLLIRSDPQFMTEIESGLKDLREERANLYTLEELFDG